MSEETPEEFLERLTQTISDEDSYLQRVYGDNYWLDPDDEELEIIPETPLPPELPENMQWRLSCLQYPERPPCDECIFRYYSVHPIYVGGYAHGKEVSQDLAEMDIIAIPIPVDPIPIRPEEILSPILNVEYYYRKTIRAILNEHTPIERRIGFIHIWVHQSVSDPRESFQMFYNYVRGT